MESVYSFKSYKSYLKALTNDKDSRGLLTKLANAAGCKLPYLSRVLSAEIHLTPDHAFKIANSLGLDSSERDYFLCLVEYDRSGDPTYRDFLKSKLKSMLQQHEDLSKRTNNPLTENSQLEFLYNSSWLYCAIHLLVSIPEYQTVPKISQKLHISESQVLIYLAQLESMNYVKRRSNRWEYLAGASHTPKNSPLVPLHHSNWRARAVTDSQNFNSEALHYTAVQSMSLSCYQKIKNLLLSSINDLEKWAGPSECEELVNINIDVYKV